MFNLCSFVPGKFFDVGARQSFFSAQSIKKLSVHSASRGREEYQGEKCHQSSLASVSLDKRLAAIKKYLSQEKRAKNCAKLTKKDKKMFGLMRKRSKPPEVAISSNVYSGKLYESKEDIIQDFSGTVNGRHTIVRAKRKKRPSIQNLEEVIGNLARLSDLRKAQLRTENLEYNSY